MLLKANNANNRPELVNAGVVTGIIPNPSLVKIKIRRGAYLNIDSKRILLPSWIFAGKVRCFLFIFWKETIPNWVISPLHNDIELIFTANTPVNR